MTTRQQRYLNRLKAAGNAPKTIQVSQNTYTKLKAMPGTFDAVICDLLSTDNNQKISNTSDILPVDEWQTVKLSDVVLLNQLLEFQYFQILMKLTLTGSTRLNIKLTEVLKVG